MEARNTVLQQKRLEVEQLRREAAMKRIPVSQALEDIKTYIRDHGQEDCLVVGFQGKNSNPYREKSSCQVLWWELPDKFVPKKLCWRFWTFKFLKLFYCNFHPTKHLKFEFKRVFISIKKIGQ